jgi:hypothetical protein
MTVHTNLLIVGPAHGLIGLPGVLDRPRHLPLRRLQTPETIKTKPNLQTLQGAWAARGTLACLFPKLFGAADGLAALAGELALLGLLLSLELGVQLAALVLVLDLRRQYRLRLILLRLLALALPPPLALVALRRRRVGGRLLPLLLLRHHRRQVAAS